MDREWLARTEAEVRAQCVAFDPASLPLPEAPPTYESLSRMINLLEGARTRMLFRVHEANPGARTGERSTEEWAARRSGSSYGAAKERMDTSKRLQDQPSIDEALANGDLSQEKASAISDAAGADPAAERDLVDAAKKEGVKDLKDRCNKVKANAHPNDEARREAIRRSRHFRTFTDKEGGWNCRGRMLPEHGAEVEALLAPFTQAAFDAARKEGDRENHDAYRADGLLGMARSTKAAAAGGVVEVPKGASQVETKLFVHVDLETLLRNRTQPGSICHIDRIGPVDLQWVREHLGEAFVVALLKQGESIADVVHLGRHATALQRSYKEAQGVHCEVPGCSRTEGLELHHVEEYGKVRRTVADELAWVCDHDHDLITYKGFRLSGSYGDRVWTARDGTVIARHQPVDDDAERAGPAPPPVSTAPRASAEPPRAGPQPSLFADPSAA